MIKKNILGLLFLLSALCLFNSCEDDPYYDDYGWATDALCNNTWVDFYTNNKGYECEQRLDFYNDHTGEDFTIIYYPNGMTDELKTSFYWDWKDEYFDSFPDCEGYEERACCGAALRGFCCADPGASDRSSVFIFCDKCD